MTYFDKLQPIETAPKDGTWILLFGPSGYTSVPLRCEVGRYQIGTDSVKFEGWFNHANNWFTEGGAEPTRWLPMPTL